MKRKQHAPASSSKPPPKMDANKKGRSLPPDVRTLWAKAKAKAEDPEVTTTATLDGKNAEDNDDDDHDSDFEEVVVQTARQSDGFSSHEDFGAARLPVAALSNQDKLPANRTGLYYYFNLNSLLDGKVNDNGGNIASHQNPLIRVSNAADLQSLPNNLKPSGLVIGDGNCLARSILLAHTGSQNGYQQLRLSVVQKLRSSRLQFEPELHHLYNCSVEDYCARMANDFEFGDIIFIQAAAAVLDVEIKVFTLSSKQNGTSSLMSQIFTPSHGHILTIQIHLDSGHSEQHWNVDAETGLRRVTNILMREPHFDTLAADDRSDSGVNLQESNFLLIPLPITPNNRETTLVPGTGIPLDPTKKPIIKFDPSLPTKSAFCFVDENGVLNLVTAPFESFKRLNESA
ncbi:hypothetical protein CcCBS67573_g10640, partial [Chytriomyces confervae]